MDQKQYELFKAEQAMELPYPDTSLKGKTVIVTGANTGLGKEAARHFVRCRASRVIIAVRSQSKGEDAKADIEATTGIKGVAEVWPLDLSSYASVRTFAERAAALDRIDVLIQNASVAMEKAEIAEGTEVSMTVNMYATFLLVMLLLPKLKETAKKLGTQPVMNVVASSVGWGSAFEERNSDNILGTIDSDAKMGARYPLTKLLQMIVMRELGTELSLEKTGVILNYLNPGLCKTELSRNVSGDTRARIDKMKGEIGRTAEDGSRNLFYAAVVGPESHGSYLSECRIIDSKVPDWLTSEDGRRIQTKLWKELEERLEKIEPGCVQKAFAA